MNSRQLVIRNYEEILCRPVDKDGLENYVQHLDRNKSFNLRSTLLNCTEYNTQIKNKDLLICLRYQIYSHKATSIIADRMIGLLRQFPNLTVCNVEYTEEDTGDTIINRLREIVFNNNGEKQLLIMGEFQSWFKSVVQWWKSQNFQNTTVMGYLIANMSCIEETKIPQYNLFDVIAIPTACVKEIFIYSGINKPLHIIPYPLRTYTFNAPKTFQDIQRIVLYIIDNPHSSQNNFMMLAYWTIYYISTNENNIKLIVKGHNHQIMNELQSYCDHLHLTADKVQLITKIATSEEMQKIHDEGTIYVSLSPLNTNLSIAEALCHGNLIVCPKSGACAEQLPATYPYFVNVVDDFIGTYIRICHKSSLIPYKWINAQETDYYFDALNIAIDAFMSGEHVKPLLEAQHQLKQSSSLDVMKMKLEDMISYL